MSVTDGGSGFMRTSWGVAKVATIAANKRAKVKQVLRQQLELEQVLRARHRMLTTPHDWVPSNGLADICKNCGVRRPMGGRPMLKEYGCPGVPT